MPTLSTLLYIYIGAALLGLSVSILSFVFGGMEDMDTDTDFHLEGGIDHPDEIGAGGQGGIVISHLLTIRNFMTFLVGFGAAGAAAVNAHATAGQSVLVGIFGGLLLAYLGYLFFKLIKAQQGNSALKVATLVGKPAAVVTGIPEGGYGEVRLNDQYGSPVTLPARSKDGAIAEGSAVQVVRVVGSTAFVTKLPA